MLDRAHRLRRSGEFAVTVRAGRRAGRGAVVVHLRTDPGEARPPRVGFIVSRAVGGAVVRNTVRRRLRHLVREQLAAVPAGGTLVVRARPPAARASYHQLRADLAAALAAVTTPAGRSRGSVRA